MKKILLGMAVAATSLLASCGQSNSVAPTADTAVVSQSESGWMTKRVVVFTEDSGKAVEGAKVFDNKTNTLLGKTDSSGVLVVKVKAGMQLRVVEPLYGQYQNIIDVKAPSLSAQDASNSYYNGWPLPTP